MPRVVTGKYKGAVLFAPKGDTTRPTTDKVKESLFSIIQTRVYDARVLDLFSGCGQIAIEAVSRGARSAVMVDKGGEQISVIKRNLEKIREDRNGPFKILKMNYDQALIRLGESGEKFDLIYMDPPYKMAEAACRRTCEIIKEYDMLSEDGILMCEHSSDLPFDTSEMALRDVRSCSYSLTVITFLSRDDREG